MNKSRIGVRTDNAFAAVLILGMMALRRRLRVELVSRDQHSNQSANPGADSGHQKISGS